MLIEASTEGPGGKLGAYNRGGMGALGPRESFPPVFGPLAFPLVLPWAPWKSFQPHSDELCLR